MRGSSRPSAAGGSSKASAGSQQAASPSRLPFRLSVNKLPAARGRLPRGLQTGSEAILGSGQQATGQDEQTQASTGLVPPLDRGLGGR